MLGLENKNEITRGRNYTHLLITDSKNMSILNLVKLFLSLPYLSL